MEVPSSAARMRASRKSSLSSFSVMFAFTSSTPLRAAPFYVPPAASSSPPGSSGAIGYRSGGPGHAFQKRLRAYLLPLLRAVLLHPLDHRLGDRLGQRETRGNVAAEVNSRPQARLACFGGLRLKKRRILRKQVSERTRVPS